MHRQDSRQLDKTTAWQPWLLMETLLFPSIAQQSLSHGMFVREMHRAIVRAARAARVREDERINSEDVSSLQAENVREEPVHASCRHPI